MAELNIKARPVKDKEGVAVLRRLWELGYERVAWNHTIFGKPSQANLSNLSKSAHTLPVADMNASLAMRRLAGTQSSTLEQYQRLTVIVDDFAEAQSLHSSNDSLKPFDILSATPANAKVFNHLCREADIDIISIDFTRHLPFSIAKKTVDEAVKRGIFFEVKLGPMLFNSSHRREIISNVKHLIRVLRGRNIVLSSGMESSTQLRGPMDMVNMGKMIFLSEKQSMEAVYNAWQKVLQHALARRRRYLPVALTTYQNLLNTLSQHEEAQRRHIREDEDRVSGKRRKRDSDEKDGDDEGSHTEEDAQEDDAQPASKRSFMAPDDGILMFE